MNGDDAGEMKDELLEKVTTANKRSKKRKCGPRPILYGSKTRRK